MKSVFFNSLHILTRNNSLSIFPSLALPPSFDSLPFPFLLFCYLLFSLATIFFFILTPVCLCTIVVYITMCYILFILHIFASHKQHWVRTNCYIIFMFNVHAAFIIIIILIIIDIIFVAAAAAAVTVDRLMLMLMPILKLVLSLSLAFSSIPPTPRHIKFRMRSPSAAASWSLFLKRWFYRTVNNQKTELIE